MISMTLLFGAVLIIGFSLVATFWNDITVWLRKVVLDLKARLTGVLHGFRVFIKKIGDKVFKEISKHYSKKGNQWQETIVTTDISASKVPEEIRRKANSYNETDITDEYGQALSI